MLNQRDPATGDTIEVGTLRNIDQTLGLVAKNKGLWKGGKTARVGYPDKTSFLDIYE